MCNKIHKFGFEIEGEFTHSMIKNKLEIANFDEDEYEESRESDYGGMHSDSSVSSCYNESRATRAYKKWHEKHNNDMIEAEFASAPFPFTESGIKKSLKVFDLFQEGWENGEYHNNPSCGFHIHVSFTPEEVPPEIVSEEFDKYFTERMASTFTKEFKERKNNRYCMAGKLTEVEIANKQHDRYRAVNFNHLSDRRKTVEFRIFPSAEPKKMLEYLQFTLKVVSDFLTKHKLQRHIVFEIEEDTITSVDYKSIVDTEPLQEEFKDIIIPSRMDSNINMTT